MAGIEDASAEVGAEAAEAEVEADVERAVEKRGGAAEVMGIGGGSSGGNAGN